MLGCTRIRKQDERVLRSQKKMYAKSLLSEAATALQLGESCTDEAPYKEELALSRESDSLHLAGTMVRRAMKAGKEDDLSELLKSSELNPVTRVKLLECTYEVRHDDHQRKSIVQQIMQ